jgi:hypothetical protein
VVLHAEECLVGVREALDSHVVEVHVRCRGAGGRQRFLIGGETEVLRGEGP